MTTSIFNITYDPMKSYRQVSKAVAEKMSTQKNFKCFQFIHIYRIPSQIGPTTLTRMVKFKDNQLLGVTKWQ